MNYLHTMVRVKDLEESLEFYCDHLGLIVVKRMENEAGRYTLVFLGTSENSEGMVELTYNWDPEVYTEGRNFGHLAFQVEDIYAMCQKLMDAGMTKISSFCVDFWIPIVSKLYHAFTVLRCAQKYQSVATGFILHSFYNDKP